MKVKAKMKYRVVLDDETQDEKIMDVWLVAILPGPMNQAPNIFSCAVISDKGQLLKCKSNDLMFDVAELVK